VPALERHPKSIFCVILDSLAHVQAITPVVVELACDGLSTLAHKSSMEMVFDNATSTSSFASLQNAKVKSKSYTVRWLVTRFCHLLVWPTLRKLAHFLGLRVAGDSNTAVDGNIKSLPERQEVRQHCKAAAGNAVAVMSDPKGFSGLKSHLDNHLQPANVLHRQASPTTAKQKLASVLQHVLDEEGSCADLVSGEAPAAPPRVHAMHGAPSLAARRELCRLPDAASKDIGLPSYCSTRLSKSRARP